MFKGASPWKNKCVQSVGHCLSFNSNIGRFLRMVRNNNVLYNITKCEPADHDDDPVALNYILYDIRPCHFPFSTFIYTFLALIRHNVFYSFAIYWWFGRICTGHRWKDDGTQQKSVFRSLFNFVLFIIFFLDFLLILYTTKMLNTIGNCT